MSGGTMYLNIKRSRRIVCTAGMHWLKVISEKKKILPEHYRMFHAHS